MFDATSRYAQLETTTWTDPSGKVRTLVKRRFLPRGQELDLLVELRVDEGDRLDLIAHRTLGNSELFWRVCDASDALDPFLLTDEAGTTVRVPFPSAR